MKGSPKGAGKLYKKLLITGGSGFIGSAICRYLVQDLGLQVLNIDKLTYAACSARLSTVGGHSGYEFWCGDICDAATVRRAFREFEPDAVVHLAAESHVDRSITSSDVFVRTNVLGTHVLLEAARFYWDALDRDGRERFRFMHVSTDEVYGSLGEAGFFAEDTPYDPTSPYSASKAASDHLARAWCLTYGLPVIVSNCSNNYGPYQFPEKLIPLTILNALERKPLPVYGSGRNVRDWLHVDDHVRALHQLLEHGRPGRSYNIGSNNELSNLEVVGRICKIMDAVRPESGPHSGLIMHTTDRPGHDYRYAINSERIRNEIGWHPQVEFDIG
jgi:dTDP-glucose 4,6-dehydratase